MIGAVYECISCIESESFAIWGLWSYEGFSLALALFVQVKDEEDEGSGEDTAADTSLASQVSRDLSL